MATCLLSLGSNLGDREGAIRGALDAIAELDGVKVLRQSELYRTQPIGGRSGQGEFLNAAAVIETEIEPLALLDELQRIENRFGRSRGERWAARTLDIDILLVGDTVIDAERLTVPHPRMSFRRFVLEPSAEIAAEIVHPVIGWTIGELQKHLDSASDRMVILSADRAPRDDISKTLTARCRATVVSAPTSSAVAKLWPPTSATWFEFPAFDSAAPPRPSAAAKTTTAEFPKLTIILGGGSERHGRGPTLTLRTADPAVIGSEVLAAARSVWPDLCRQ